MFDVASGSKQSRMTQTNGATPFQVPSKRLRVFEASVGAIGGIGAIRWRLRAIPEPVRPPDILSASQKLPTFSGPRFSSPRLDSHVVDSPPPRSIEQHEPLSHLFLLAWQLAELVRDILAARHRGEDVCLCSVCVDASGYCLGLRAGFFLPSGPSGHDC